MNTLPAQSQKKNQATSPNLGPFVLKILVDYENWPFGPYWFFSSSHIYIPTFMF